MSPRWRRIAAILLVGGAVLFAYALTLVDWSLLAPSPAVDAGQTVLDDPAYRFCHIDGFDASDATEFCSLLEGLPEDRCPGLRASCDGAQEVRAPGCGGGGGTPGSELAEGPDRPPPLPGMSCDDQADLSANALRWFAAAAVAAVVLLFLRVAASAMGRRPAAAPVRRARVVDLPVDEETDLPDMPGEDLLASARRALDAGDPGQAVLLARAAALRQLGDGGKLRLHRARTDREYVRALRSDSEAQGALREVIRAVEGLRWGGHPLDTSRAAAAVSAAARLFVVWMLVLLPAVGWSQVPGERYGPVGDAGALEALRDAGFRVSWRLEPLSELGDETDVVVLDLSGVRPTADDWERLHAWVTEEGGVLVVAGTWVVAAAKEGEAAPADQTFPQLGETTQLLPNETHLGPVAEHAGMTAPRWAGGAGVGWREAGGEPWVVARETETGDLAVVVQSVNIGTGTVVAISDPMLLWNGALVDPVNEQFLGELLWAGQAQLGFPIPTPCRVQLATRAAGENPSPVKSMANARMLPLILQLGLFWLMLGLWRGWPFGPLRDPPDEGRLRFVDHVKALGDRLRQAGASRHAASQYCAMQLGRLGPRGIELAALRSGLTAEAARTLVAEVQTLADHPDVPSHPGDLHTVEELWSIINRK